MEYFDSHAHYNDDRFKTDQKDVLEKIKLENVTCIVNIGYNLKSSLESLRLANEYEFIYTTVGISPNDVENFTNNDLVEIEGLAKSKKVVAIGEIGLDYYWNKENKDLQKQVFIKQIDIANRLNLPISIHCRDAVMDTLEILKSNEVNAKGIFHCCPHNTELIKEALKLGFYISFAGPVTFKNAKNADEAIEAVPMDKLLIETDAPYLSPEPMRGKRNDSGNLKFIAEKIAEIKKIEIEEVAKITYDNARKIYKI